MRKYLLDKKKEIKELEVKRRLVKFPEIKNFIMCIIGPRRAGKTYSIYNLIKTKNLKDEDYLFINFEDDDVKRENRNKIVKSVFYHQEHYGKEPKFIFLDEIQNLENWESFVYSLFEKKRYYIFITGSNSKLLSKEIATQLRGRTLTTLILPFSFSEVMAIEGEKIERNVISSYQESKIKNKLRTYLKDGGFPDVVLTGINKNVYFKDYLNLVIFNDVIERYKIKNIPFVKMFISSLISSFSKELSIHKTFNTFKSMGQKISKKTLYKYADAFEDAMLCFFLKKFSFSERESMLSIPKVYINDTGVINYTISTKLTEDFGKLMENLVFLELKREEYKGEITNIFYWKDYQQHEVDFVVKQHNKIEQLIQVTYVSSKNDVEKREIISILDASKELKCNNLLVITWDYEGEEEIKGKKIRFLPLWKWLIAK